MTKEESNRSHPKTDLEKEDRVCAYCGFGISGILETAHIDRNPDNNALANLVLLCPTCHRMYDTGMISTQTIKKVRRRSTSVDWTILDKEGAKKAVETKRRKTEEEAALKERRSTIAQKAWRTRKRNQDSGTRQ